MSSITPALALQIERAIEAIPPAYREAPVDGTVVPSPNFAFQRIQDWAFTEGYAFVHETSNLQRVRFECVHHKKKTKNSRKTAEVDRRRVSTFVLGTGCQVCLYVSRQKKKGDQWVLCYSKYTVHNHPPAVDPFLLPPHRERRPGRQEALAMASSHRGIVSYRTSQNILARMDLELDRKAFYNLTRKESATVLSDQEQARMLLAYLEDHDYHLAVDEAYTLDLNGKKTDRIIVAIAWWSQEQQRQARRFIPGRLSISDATFSTNSKHMLLQHVIGIDNTGKTFPCLQMFHPTENTRAFRFVESIWRTRFFYDCPGPAIWCADFAAGLASAYAEIAAEEARAAKRAEEKATLQGKGKEVAHSVSATPLKGDPPSRATSYKADSQTIVVDCTDLIATLEDTAPAHDGSRIKLQYCEWHASEAIKKRLIRKGYSKEKRDALVDLIWKYIKASNFSDLTTARTALKAALRDSEKAYLASFYEPKEHNFCRAFTRRYPNLGVHSTQRVEGYHHVASYGLSKNISVNRAVEIICERVDRLGKEYDTRINKERLTTPRLLDIEFFQYCDRRFTHYCLEKAMVELAQAKILLDDLEQVREDFDFDPKVGCELSCELPLQYGIPCKCWMAYFYSNDLPLPPNLFDPRWLYDGPSVLYSNWEMKLDNPDYDQSTILEERYAGDRFRDRGGQLIKDTAILMAEKHKTLPPEDAAKFALSFKELSDQLAKKQEEKLKSREELPGRLPDPQRPPKLTFGPGRKRALTGREVADQQEADEARARRKADRLQKEAQRAEELIDEQALLQSQFQDEIVAAYFDQGIIHDEEDQWVDIDDSPTKGESSKVSKKARLPRLQPVPIGRAQAIRDTIKPKQRSQKTNSSKYNYSSQQKLQVIPVDGGYISSNSESQEEPLETQFALNNAAKSDSCELSGLESNHKGDGNDSDSSHSTDPFSDLFPTIEEICSQPITYTTARAPLSTTPTSATIKRSPPSKAIPPSTAPPRLRRARKPTAKQASQNRRREEAKSEREAKLKKKLVDTSQLVDDLDLPFHSS
jgi:hypothetical protein